MSKGVIVFVLFLTLAVEYTIITKKFLGLIRLK